MYSSFSDESWISLTFDVSKMIHFSKQFLLLIHFLGSYSDDTSCSWQLTLSISMNSTLPLWTFPHFCSQLCAFIFFIIYVFFLFHFSTPSGLYCCCRADRSTPPTVPLIPLNTPTLFPCGIKPPVWLTCSQTRWTEREKHMDSDNVCVCLRER